MNKRILSILAFGIFTVSITSAKTIIPGGYVSGTWTAVNSPYLIQDEITIHADSLLTIDPGVEVIFQGHYKFNVAGIIQAEGTEQDSILFSAQSPDTGWWGLRFNSAPEGSRLSYCILRQGWAKDGLFRDKRGGAIYIYASKPKISHCTISDNTADVFGGGIYIESVSGRFPSIEYCTFRNNVAAYGGGIYLSTGSLDMTGCVFDGNTANSPGGGLYLNCVVTDSVKITRCTINNNSSGQIEKGGGGIYMNGGHLFINNSSVTSNQSGLTGGGIYCAGNVSMRNTILQGNISHGGNTEYETGGGGLIGFGNCIIDSCVIADNISYTGSRYSYGGGILIRKNGGLSEITNSKIINNSGDFCGGLMITNDVATLANCEITHNRTFLNGTGGAWIRSWIIRVEHCTFFKNYGGESGNGSLSVNNDAIVSNSIFCWNSPVAIHLGEAVAVVYSDFFENEQDVESSLLPGFGIPDSTNINGDSCDVYSNIFLDPLFADTSMSDFHLTENSPCIDAGDPSSPYDPDNTVADMGRYFFNQGPVIATSDSLLDFGEVFIGQQNDLALIIRNGRLNTLRLNSIINQQPVFTHNWNPADSLILPGDSLTITVTFTPVDINLITDTLLIENNNMQLQVRLSGKGKTVVGIEDQTSLPKVYELSPAYPNPFNPVTTIEFDLPKQSYVDLKVYNILGEEVSILLEKQMSPGRYSYIWNAKNIASGIYFYRLNAGEFSKVRKIILVR